MFYFMFYDAETKNPFGGFQCFHEECFDMSAKGEGWWFSGNSLGMAKIACPTHRRHIGAGEVPLTQPKDYKGKVISLAAYFYFDIVGLKELMDRL